MDLDSLSTSSPLCRYIDGVFELSIDGQNPFDLSVRSDLALDTTSENYHYQILPLVKKDLKESDICEVLDAKSRERIGWIMPANALSSKEHDFAENKHFLRYAYVAIREVLLKHRSTYQQRALEAITLGERSMPFSDLFHNNESFLVICLELVDEKFSFDRVLPSLISLGYLPRTVCAPENVKWRGQPVEPNETRLLLWQTGSAVSNPELPARLFELAATSGESAVVNFFLLYQVVELLLEEVFRTLMPPIGMAVMKSIEEERFSDLRDLLRTAGTRVSEKARLEALMQSFQGGSVAITDLSTSAKEFLRQVGENPSEGILAVYAVRNYVVHQARNVPVTATSALADTVASLSTFLPQLLAGYKALALERPPSTQRGRHLASR